MELILVSLRLRGMKGFDMKKQIMLYGLFLGIGLGLGSLATTLIFHPPRPPKWESKIELTKEEKLKIRELFKEEGKQGFERRKKLNEKRQELKKMMKDPLATEEKLKLQYEEVAVDTKGWTDAQFERSLKVRRIIGPEKMDSFDPFGGPRGLRKGGKRGPAPEDMEIIDRGMNQKEMVPGKDGKLEIREKLNAPEGE